MKKIGLITVALAVLTFSCEPPKNQETLASADSLANERIDTKAKIDNGHAIDNKQAKEFDKYEMTFEFEDNEQEFKQRLGVTWLTNDSIEFRLSSENGICDTGYWGNAKNNYPDMDPESDEDESGESYLAAEYVTEEETYLLKIRIALGKDRARIVFVDKSGEDTDCIPTADLVLVRKNAR